MKKDIIFLCQYFYPENVSSSILPFQTAKHLSENGFSVSVLTGKSKKYNNLKNIKNNEIVDGIHIKRVNYLNFKSKNKILRLLTYLSYVVMTYSKLNFIRKHKLIIVYSNPPILPKIALLANKLFKTKIMFVSYDVYPEIAINMESIKKNGIIAKSTRKMNDKLFKKSSRIVALSNDMKEFLINNRDVDNNNIVVIPNWHDDLAIHRDLKIELKRFKNYKESKDFVISYMGNLGIMQDVETVIESAKSIKNEHVKFLFSGHGNKVDYLINQIQKHSLKNVSFNGYLSGNDFKEAIYISDIFIVSLVKQGTGLAVPSKTYSYLMGGKPIIAIMDKNTDIAKELIEYNAGFVIESNDVEEFNHIVEMITSDKNLTKTMGENARRLFLDKYTKELNVNKYKDEVIRIINDSEKR